MQPLPEGVGLRRGKEPPTIEPKLDGASFKATLMLALSA
jgi:hypothetical protein